MARPKMPLEELGLLCLLEKVGDATDDMDAYAKLGLVQDGLVTDSDPPRLTRLGEQRLAELREWRDEGEVDLDAPTRLRP